MLRLGRLLTSLAAATPAEAVVVLRVGRVVAGEVMLRVRVAASKVRGVDAGARRRGVVRLASTSKAARVRSNEEVMGTCRGETSQKGEEMREGTGRVVGEEDDVYHSIPFVSATAPRTRCCTSS